jgi:regulator of sigma E protease
MVTGKPVSEQFQATAQQFGIFLLVALMALAFYNDILRLFG